MTHQRKAWCPAVKEMVNVTGIIRPLPNELKELHVVTCELAENCEKNKLDDDCILNHDIQGKW